MLRRSLQVLDIGFEVREADAQLLLGPDLVIGRVSRPRAFLVAFEVEERHVGLLPVKLRAIYVVIGVELVILLDLLGLLVLVVVEIEFLVFKQVRLGGRLAQKSIPALKLLLDLGDEVVALVNALSRIHLVVFRGRVCVLLDKVEANHEVEIRDHMLFFSRRIQDVITVVALSNLQLLPRL